MKTPQNDICNCFNWINILIYLDGIYHGRYIKYYEYIKYLVLMGDL